MPQYPQTLCRSVDVLDDGPAFPFLFLDPTLGVNADGFIIRRGGVARGFRNQCRHQPLLLDYGDGDLLTSDMKYLFCRHHGALYDTTSGKCLSGPCGGASLLSLPIEERDGTIYLLAPPEFELD